MLFCVQGKLAGKVFRSGTGRCLFESEWGNGKAMHVQ
jgi:hypothetical protein